MDKKPEGTQSPKLAAIPEQLSAFEMSINLEFQVDPQPKALTPPKVGDPCPLCRLTKIDYDGSLNLSCPDCGYSLAGCFT